MKQYLSALAILSCLTLITACGGNPTSTTKLEISKGFAFTNPHFAGGLIIIAESGNKKISIALDSTTSHTIDLPRKTTWKFTAIGWDGGAGDVPFDGNYFCDETENFVDGDAVTVNLKVTTAKCSDPVLAPKLNIKNLWVTACGAFYEYNPMSTLYSPIGANNAFCSSLPFAWQNPTMQKYKIFAMNIIGDAKSDGFSSGCKSANASSIERLDIPTTKLPFIVKFYNTNAECTANSPARTFEFPNGLDISQPALFDQDLYVNGTVARLTLPSKNTKRGKTPFINMIPQLLCGSSNIDCLANPTVSSHVRVPWDENSGTSGKQLLLSNTADLDCSALTLNNIKHFNLNRANCSVQDGRIKGEIFRNQLTCQEPSDFDQIKDIYQRDGRIFTLSIDPATSDTVFKVFDLAGKRITQHIVGSQSFDSIAVDGNFNVYLANSQASTQSVSKYYYNPVLNNYSLLTSYNLSFVNKLEVDITGTYLFYDNTSTNIHSYNTSSSTGSTLAQRAGSIVHELKIINGYLYSIEDVSSSFYIDKMLISFSDGTLGFRNTLVNGSAAPYKSISYSATTSTYYLAKSTGEIEQRNAVFTMINSLPYTAPITTPSGIISVENDIFVVSSTTGDFKSLRHLNSSIDNIGNTSLECSQTDFTIMDSNNNLHVLKLESRQDSGSFSIFSDALEQIGLRNLTFQDGRPFSYFRALREDDDQKMNLRTGGKLKRVQEMLSPAALGGAFSQYSTCPQLLAAVTGNGGSLTRTIEFNDEETGAIEKVSVTASAAPVLAINNIGSYFCDSTLVPQPICSSAKYDLILSFYASGAERELMEIKLSCATSRRIGSFESLENKGTGDRKELVIWNTENSNSMRFENYSLDENDWINVTKVRKTTSDNLSIRSISLKDAGGDTFGTTLQMQRDSTKWITSVLNLKHPTGTFNSHTATTNYVGQSFEAIRDHNDYNAISLSPYACMTVINTNPMEANSFAGCPSSFSTLDGATSKGVPLSLSGVNDGGVLINNAFTLIWPP